MDGGGGMEGGMEGGMWGGRKGCVEGAWPMSIDAESIMGCADLRSLDALNPAGQLRISLVCGVP